MAARRSAEQVAPPLSPEGFGWLLRDLREAAGMKIAPLARQVPCDSSLLSRFESAERVPKLSTVQRLDVLLDTGGQLERAWGKVDWHREIEHPDWFKQFVKFESTSALFRDYSVSAIPGLLQTPEYARALLARGPAHKDGPTLEQRVAARMSRQDRFLTEDGPLAFFLIDEGVLRRMVGGGLVMYHQLRHILDVIERYKNIVVQIAPDELGDRVPTTESFTLVRQPDGTEVIYSESVTRGHFSRRPDEIERLSRDYDRLRADALSASESADLIRRIMEGLLNVSPEIQPLPTQISWFKATYSGNNGGNCIETSHDLRPSGLVPVRDSKNPGGPALVFPADSFAGFIQGIKTGGFGTV
ncbi:Scr1 family TA system antitoxin-like transcriptional regulator [Kitasatospora sp. NBC_01287]|uniref:Scr1 family TA system antitoxin-like transcriptional regulator n=1 Tax=Kitasatospora sp. NBC_01287 TaxID=2903573 RepID=UPI00225818F1|nr:Scr1 family TA system antitoxin-like transcriptional regulator [Kitasatospora sp. NBC_01287]MCX4749751.1 Scr1 family TA system antitoxin-like transcriptional regulator [Kitasatospora sp. NBC_01287]